MNTAPRALPFTVYPKKAKLMVLVLVGVLFVGVGVLMIRDGETTGWFCAVFFGLCLLAFLAQLLPGSSYLTVDEQGIEFSALFRKVRLRWSEIAEFGISTVRHHGLPVSKMVGLNYSPEYQGLSRGRAVSKALTGFEGGLPDTYGFKAEDLAQLLSDHHRDRVRRDGR